MVETAGWELYDVCHNRRSLLARAEWPVQSFGQDSKCKPFVPLLGSFLFVSQSQRQPPMLQDSVCGGTGIAGYVRYMLESHAISALQLPLLTMAVAFIAARRN